MNHIDKKSAKFIEKCESFRKSEVFNTWVRLRKNRLLLYGYRQNYARLKRQFDQYKDIHSDINYMERFWSNEQPHFRWNYQKTITTNILNYLSSISTVIDITRNIAKTELSVHENIQRYESEKERRFDENIQSRFVRDLRNYALHVSRIQVGVTFRSEWIDNNILHQTGFPYLDKLKLADWKRWKLPAKKFIDEQNDKIDIGKIFQEYHDDFIYVQNLLWKLILVENRGVIKRLIYEMDELVNNKRTKNIGINLPFRLSTRRYLSWIITKELK